MLRYLAHPEERAHSHAHHSAALISRILETRASQFQPTLARDPVALLRETGELFDDLILDAQGVTLETATIE